MTLSSSCPTCEYTGRKTDIHRETAEGLFVCSSCGTKWRDIKSSPKIYPPKDASSQETDTEPVITRRWHNSETVIISFFGSILLAAALYLLPGTQLMSAITSPKTTLSRDKLAISEVSVENLTNSNHPIWVISGKVNNNSSHTLHIPLLNIRSGKRGSSGYFKWTYRAALQKLAPGASFRFRTTISKPSGSARDIEVKFGST